MGVCFFCQRDTGELALFGRLPGDAEAPHCVVLDMRPCDECKKWMEKGIILISVKDGEETANPFRTGGWCVVKDEALSDLVQPPELLVHILKKRVAFIPDEAWDKLGLPRGEEKPDAESPT